MTFIRITPQPTDNTSRLSPVTVNRDREKCQAFFGCAWTNFLDGNLCPNTHRHISKLRAMWAICFDSYFRQFWISLSIFRSIHWIGQLCLPKHKSWTACKVVGDFLFTFWFSTSFLRKSFPKKKSNLHSNWKYRVASNITSHRINELFKTFIKDDPTSKTATHDWKLSPHAKINHVYDITFAKEKSPHACSF